MTGDDLGTWRSRLAVATAECAAHLHKHCTELWTPALRPGNFGPDSLVSAQAVDELLVLRRRILPATGSPAASRIDALDTAGLLAYDPAQSLSDGGASELTGGLVDVNSCAP
jgi:hypothetical protein